MGYQKNIRLNLEMTVFGRQKYFPQIEQSGFDDDSALALDHEKKLDGFDLLNHS